MHINIEDVKSRAVAVLLTDYQNFVTFDRFFYVSQFEINKKN